MTEKLLIMQNYLKQLGLTTRYNEYEEKLYLLDSKNKEKVIREKCDEIGVIYTINKEPIYSSVDPITLEREIIGFKKTEESIKKGDFK